MKNLHVEIGLSGESRAVLFLREQGYSVIRRNFKFRCISEIDIIATKGELLVFVEVRTKQSDNFCHPVYSLNPKKIKSLKTGARAFLCQNPCICKNYTFRFDLITICNGELMWLRDIIRE